ncbi:MAG: DUF1851 domain-containing protein [Myxococcales bacterium]|nr:DUF1851 domain-containing protein [Myxococcales bacterium]
MRRLLAILGRPFGRRRERGAAGGPYFVEVDADALARGLTAWAWLGLEGRRPIRVTAFGGVFFAGADGVWFLDPLDGSLTPVCAAETELDASLVGEDAEDQYLLAPFVDRARREGLRLGPGEVYQFKIAPALGGPIAFANIEPASLVVALSVTGALHALAQAAPPGTAVVGVAVDGVVPEADGASEPPADER